MSKMKCIDKVTKQDLVPSKQVALKPRADQ